MRVRHLVEQCDLALELGVLEQLVDRGDGCRGQLLVVGDARHARLPGQRVRAIRVERRAQERVLQVGDVGDLVLVELLQPAFLDEEPRVARVVRHDDDLAVDRLPLRERALDLPEVLVVRVDVLEVVDLDPRLRRELLQGRRLLRLVVDVDVVLPVGEAKRLRRAAARPASASSTAGREQPWQRQQGGACGPALEKLAPGDDDVHSLTSWFGRSTTNVDAAAHVTVTCDPTAGTKPPASEF